MPRSLIQPPGQFGPQDVDPALDADTIAVIDRVAPPWDQSVPAVARVGDAGNGWSFVLLPCTAYWEFGRTGPESPFGHQPSHGIRTLSADGGFNGSRPDFLNNALAELGWDADEEPEKGEGGEIPPHAPSHGLVYEALGNVFGLGGLPRAAIENNTLPGMFCETRELPRHEYADAPAGPSKPCGQRGRCGGRKFAIVTP
ncbi:hypothetical protein [Streptomyces sp. NPDC058240]|uniref:hypothetical protein n=1 Tax=Streptomyces sp. NPDC058240 TaxID=3346396 RepID=UPI0036EB810E